MVIKVSYKILSFFLAIAAVAGLCFYSESKLAVQTLEEAGTPVPIIMYHHILEQNDKLGAYVISPQQFEADLTYLKEQGFTTISGRELIDFAEKGTPLPEKPILISFDDGYESTYQYAYPILKKLSCKAVVSIVGSYVDLYSGDVQKDISYSHLSWDQVKELSDSGFIEIGNHTYDMHQSTGARKGCRIKKGETTEDYQAILADDVGRLQDKINTITGEKPEIFAYPFGFFCKESVLILKQMGIKLTLGCEEGITNVSGPDSLINMQRFNRASGTSSETFFKRKLPI